MWQHELDKPVDFDLEIGIDFYEIREIPVTLDTWLRDSEIQTLAETLSAPVELTPPTVGNVNRAVYHLTGSSDRVLWDDDFEF